MKPIHKWLSGAALVLVVAGIAAYFFTGIVVIPVSEIAPKGAKFWMWRVPGFSFIESPQSWCQKHGNGVPICPLQFLARVGEHKDQLITSLP